MVRHKLTCAPAGSGCYSLHVASADVVPRCCATHLHGLAWRQHICCSVDIQHVGQAMSIAWLGADGFVGDNVIPQAGS
jgi:hypothetical protein